MVAPFLAGQTNGGAVYVAQTTFTVQQSSDFSGDLLVAAQVSGVLSCTRGDDAEGRWLADFRGGDPVVVKVLLGLTKTVHKVLPLDHILD